MTESQFIQKNKEDWETLEKLLNWKIKDPKRLSKLFTKISGDLSYAQTHYPRRSVTLYLNDLVTHVYDTMKTRNKYQFIKAFSRFFGEVLPAEIIKHRRLFYISLIVFIISFVVGAFSTLQDPDFAVTILGQDYVNVTEENIGSGDPMAIYKSGTRWGSFIGITLNNINVAFLTFVMGILGSLGTYFILIKNGIMVGVFQTLFYTKGLLKTSFLTIWIHGTIEISSIIIAGAAGLILGNSILFPSSYSRMESIKRGAVSAMYILISTIPLFIIAGSFEGFITPLTNMNDALKWGIIIVSLIFIIFVYIVNPYLFLRSGKFKASQEKEPLNSMQNIIIPAQKEEVFMNGLKQFVNAFGPVLAYIILPLLLVCTLYAFLLLKLSFDETIIFFSYSSIFEFNIGGFVSAIFIFLFGLYLFSMLYIIQTGRSMNLSLALKTILNYFITFSILSVLLFLPYYFVPGYFKILIPFLFPPSIGVYALKSLNSKDNPMIAIGDGIIEGYRQWGAFLILNIIVVLLLLISFYAYNQVIGWVIGEMLSWHDFFDNNLKKTIFINSIEVGIFSLVVYPVIHFIYKSKSELLELELTSSDLYEKLDFFGSKKAIS